MGRFDRSEMLLGPEAIKKLSGARVAVFGIGGVGGYVVEALVRSGLGSIDIIDKDRVDETNINRQIIALTSTVGKYKTDVFEARIKDISPECRVYKHTMFFLPENKEEIDFKEFDYVVDAVDTVTAKLCIIECAKEANVPVISAMGAGNKLDPTRFEVADLYKTSVCPLAKVMRRECKKRGIDRLKVVYSKEEPVVYEGVRTPGSLAFVPSAAGLTIAAEVVKDIIG